jgi:DNA polymerase-3 subunit beta
MTTAPAPDNAATKNTIVKSSVTATCRVLRSVLLASLAEAKGYVASKHSTLSSVSLTFRDAGVLKLIATDITRWYMDELTVDDMIVSGATEGTIAVACDAKRLHDVVKAMNSEERVLTLKGTLTKTVATVIGSKTGPRIEHESLVQVISSTGEYNIKGGDSTLFPLTPSLPTQWTAYDASALRSALDVAQPFVSKDLTRVHLCAALVEITPNKISVISTDGNRLAKIVRPATHVVVAPTKFLVHLNAIGDLLDRCKVITKACKQYASIEMGLQGNNIFWKGEGARRYAVQHEVGADRYPPYGQVIPRSFDRGVTVERAPFITAMKRLKLVANQGTYGCAFRLPASATMPPHIFLVETDDGEGQAAKEKVAFKPDAFDGKSLTIGVSLKYLIEALDSFTNKTVWLGFNGDLDPIGVRERSTDADIIVLMPMRV